MKQRIKCRSYFMTLAVIALLAVAPAAWAGVGSGTLTIDNNNDLCPGANGSVGPVSPNHWDVYDSGDIVHINISPGFSICTAGPNLNDRCSGDSACNVGGLCSGQPGNKTCNANSPVNANGQCTTNADCSYTAPAGTCAAALECSSGDVVYKAHDGTACSLDSDCTGTYETGCDTDLGSGFCKVAIPVPGTYSGTSSFNGCLTVPNGTCETGLVAYCGQNGLLANVNNPTGTEIFGPADVRVVESPAAGDKTDVVVQCGGENLIADCTNTPGSFCCGLTQGAYGGPNTVATAGGACPTCNSGVCSSDSSVSCTTAAECPPDPGLGFLTAAACQGCNAFTLVGTEPTDSNATTIGVIGTRSVTLNDIQTLIAYLPSGGTASRFNTTGPIAPGPSTNYSGGNIGGSQNVSGSGSKGNGAGVLAGQTMACELNSFLSACPTPFGGTDTTFTASGFGGFQVGSLVCTKRSGPDDVVGTGDDVCQAFSYPACAVGKTVQQLVDCANAYMATGSSTCGCSASDLNVALSNVNQEFDQCGNVIDCGSVTTAGVFTCP
jgi:hypothetical protein